MKRIWLRKFLTNPCWLGLAISAWAFLLFATASSRGFTQSGLWQIEQAESVRAWLATLATFGRQAFGEQPLHSAFVTDPYRGPFNGIFAAALWRVFGVDGDAVKASHLANMLCVCLTAWCLFGLARRAGGLLAGLCAAVALVSVPRIWGAANSPGLTAGALFAFTVSACFLERARDRARWFVPAVLLLSIAILTTQMALLLIIPWIYLTFFGESNSTQSGALPSRSLSWWAPWVFPLALLAAFLAVATVPGGSKEQFLHYLKAFMVRPRVPTLYLGQVFAEKRLPWHAAPLLTALTIPPTVLFMTIYGLVATSPVTAWVKRHMESNKEQERSPAADRAMPFDRTTRADRVTPSNDAMRADRVTPSDDATRADRVTPSNGTVEARDALRLTWGMLLVTLSIPLLLGTTHSHGVDLLALIVPWCAVYTGVAVAHLLTTVAVALRDLLTTHSWARLATLLSVSALAWSVFFFALKDTDSAYPEVESYYNWLIGGAQGAARSGLPRYPQGPLPPSFLSALVPASDQVEMAVLGEDESAWAIIERYRQHNLIPQGLIPTQLQNADLVVLRFNELSSDYYRQLPDFLAAAAGLPPSSVYWLRSGAIPLYGALRF